MRRIHLSSGLLALALATGLALPSSSVQDEPTPLQAAMGGLQGGQRAMRKMVADPVANKDALLQTLSRMQASALTAYGLPPAAPEGTAGARAQAWRIGFQRQILSVLDTLLEMELATHTADAAALEAGYAKLGETKKSGHDTYQ